MIAIYLRLSIADGDMKDDKDESNSIENQREMLQEFVRRKKDLTGEIREYVDDGYSGTNFDRPAFKQMLEDMKRGEIDTMITKDLSRLGRNYIEVGDYMEQIFPMLGVRYIAVASNYDSNDCSGNTIGMEMSVMNLVNSLYSKDLSKKFRSSVEVKWKNGKSTSGRPPFGYIRNTEDHSMWDIEPFAAAIVRRIFELAMEGNAIKQICNILNEESVMTPGQYRIKFGFMKSVNRKVKDSEWLWSYTMVHTILSHYEYTGALVHGKAKGVTVCSKKRRVVPEKDRFIYEGHHEPIVSREEYDKARQIIRKFKKSGNINHDDYVLKDKIYCGNCGLRMAHPVLMWESYVQCMHKKNVGKKSRCSDTKYPTAMIDFTVRRALRRELLKLEGLSDELQEFQKTLPKRKKEVKDLTMRITAHQTDKTRLYESYAAGNINRETYINKRMQLKNEISRLEQERDSIVTPVNGVKELSTRAGRILELAGELQSPEGLTQEVADSFIDRITIYDEEHIEIRFTFEDLMLKTSEVLAKESEEIA